MRILRRQKNSFCLGIVLVDCMLALGVAVSLFALMVLLINQRANSGEKSNIRQEALIQANRCLANWFPKTNELEGDKSWRIDLRELPKSPKSGCQGYDFLSEHSAKSYRLECQWSPISSALSKQICLHCRLFSPQAQKVAQWSEVRSIP